jgi:hypothetical protein
MALLEVVNDPTRADIRREVALFGLEARRACVSYHEAHCECWLCFILNVLLLNVLSATLITSLN